MGGGNVPIGGGNIGTSVDLTSFSSDIGAMMGAPMMGGGTNANSPDPINAASISPDILLDFRLTFLDDVGSGLVGRDVGRDNLSSAACVSARFAGISSVGAISGDGDCGMSRGEAGVTRGLGVR